MNPRILAFVAFFLFFTVVFSSCKKTESEPNYPVKISYEEFSLEGTGYQWANLPYDNKVIVINSNDELEKYMSCEEDFFPEIDFSKSTLLLASGKPANRVLEVDVTGFQQSKSDQLRLDIDVTLSDTAIHKSWVKAVITQKIPADNKVRVNITTYDDGINYPVDIPYKEYSLVGTQCVFINAITNNFITQINCNEELEKNLRCKEGGSYPDIDFSKYTLIYANGWASGSSCTTTLKSLQFTTEQNVEMRISVSSDNFFQQLHYWKFSILINKSFAIYPLYIFVEPTTL